MSKPHEPQTEYRHRDRAANLNSVLISIGGSIIVGLLLVVGYFAKQSLESINTKLDAHGEAQVNIQTDVTTIKAQLPALSQRVDKLETSQHDMWQRLGGGANTSGTKPMGDK